MAATASRAAVRDKATWHRCASLTLAPASAFEFRPCPESLSRERRIVARCAADSRGRSSTTSCASRSDSRAELDVARAPSRGDRGAPRAAPAASACARWSCSLVFHAAAGGRARPPRRRHRGRGRARAHPLRHAAARRHHRRRRDAARTAVGAAALRPRRHARRRRLPLLPRLRALRALRGGRGPLGGRGVRQPDRGRDPAGALPAQPRRHRRRLPRDHPAQDRRRSSPPARATAAHLAGAPPAVVDAMAACGQHVGLAFQMRDDLLDVEGRSRRAPASRAASTCATAIRRCRSCSRSHATPRSRRLFATPAPRRRRRRARARPHRAHRRPRRRSRRAPPRSSTRALARMDSPAAHRRPARRCASARARARRSRTPDTARLR